MSNSNTQWHADYRAARAKTEEIAFRRRHAPAPVAPIPERYEPKAQQYNNRSCNAMMTVMVGGFREAGLADDLETAVGGCLDAVQVIPQGGAHRSIFADGFRINGVEHYDTSPAFFSHRERD